MRKTSLILLGLIKVVAPIDETPAAKAGVMANDISRSAPATARCG
jgi:C-terminal processing protease CtpA/Prc